MYWLQSFLQRTRQSFISSSFIGSAPLTPTTIAALLIGLLLAQSTLAQSTLAQSTLAQSTLAQDTNSSTDKNTPNENIEGSVFFRIPDQKPFRFFTFTFQNDIFVGEDDGYTNGIALTFGQGPFLEFSPKNLPFPLHHLTKNLYIQTTPNKIRGVAHLLFQQIQTPEDITIAELQDDDVPWAGLLAAQSILYAWDKNRSDQLSFTLGIVGPSALADQAQTAVHEVVGADEPLGWSNQIGDEPVIRVEARRVSKLATNYKRRLGYDLVGLGSIGIGNLRSNVSGGLAVRFGSNLEFSHASFALQPDKQVNSLSLSPRNDFFVYAGFEAGFVANDVLMNGNTFKDSDSVPLENFLADFTAGIVFKYKSLAYVFQISSLNSRTSLTSDRDNFGAFSITYAWQ